jgi:hypothetical protein
MRTLLLLVLASISACSANLDSSPVEVSGKVVEVTRAATDGSEYTASIIEFDRPVRFKAQSYKEAMLNPYNDGIMFEIFAAKSRRIKTRCTFSSVTRWAQATLLCSPDEIRVEP